MDRIQYVNQKRPYQSLETSKISVDDEEKDDNNEMNVEESDEKESGDEGDDEKESGDEENDDDDDDDYEKESGDNESNESGDNDDESNDDDKSNECNKSSESDYTPVKPKSHRTREYLDLITTESVLYRLEGGE